MWAQEGRKASSSQLFSFVSNEAGRTLPRAEVVVWVTGGSDRVEEGGGSFKTLNIRLGYGSAGPSEQLWKARPSHFPSLPLGRVQLAG